MKWRRNLGLALAVALVLSLVPAGLAGAAGDKVIVLQIDNITARVDGQPMTLQVAPQIIDGRTMVPLRFLGEALGARVDWDGAERRITVTLGGKVLQFWVDQVRVDVAGQEFIIDVPPTVVDGRTLIPLRAAAEHLGGTVGYDPATRTVTLTFKGAPAPAPAGLGANLSDAQFRAAFDQGRLNAAASYSSLLRPYVQEGNLGGGGQYILAVLSEWAAGVDRGWVQDGALMRASDLHFLRGLRGSLLLSLLVSGRPANVARQLAMQVRQGNNTLVPQDFDVLEYGATDTEIRWVLPAGRLDLTRPFQVVGGIQGAQVLAATYDFSKLREEVAGPAWQPSRTTPAILVNLTVDQIRETWEYGRLQSGLLSLEEMLAGHFRKGYTPDGDSFRVDLLTEWMDAALSGWEQGRAASDTDLRRHVARKGQLVLRVTVNSMDAERIRNLRFRADLGPRGAFDLAAAGPPELISPTAGQHQAVYRLPVSINRVNLTGQFKLIALLNNQPLFDTAWDLAAVDELGYADGSGPRKPQILSNLTDHQRVLAWRLGILLQQQNPAMVEKILAPYGREDAGFRFTMLTEWLYAFVQGVDDAGGITGDPGRALPTEEQTRRLLDGQGQLHFTVHVPPGRKGAFELMTVNGTTADTNTFSTTGELAMVPFLSKNVNLQMTLSATVKQNGFGLADVRWDLAAINEGNLQGQAAFLFDGPGAFAPLTETYTSLDQAVSVRYPAGWVPTAPGPDLEARFLLTGNGKDLAVLQLPKPQPLQSTTADQLRADVEKFAGVLVTNLADLGMTVVAIETLAVPGTPGAILIVAQKGQIQVFTVVMGVMRNRGALYILQATAEPEAQREAEAVARAFRPTGR